MNSEISSSAAATENANALYARILPESFASLLRARRELLAGKTVVCRYRSDLHRVRRVDGSNVVSTWGKLSAQDDDIEFWAFERTDEAAMFLNLKTIFDRV